MQLYNIFISFFFFSLISIHSIVEHEEKVSVKLKTVMDYPLDRAASLYPRLQRWFWKESSSQGDFFSLSLSFFPFPFLFQKVTFRLYNR